VPAAVTCEAHFMREAPTGNRRLPTQRQIAYNDNSPERCMSTMRKKE